MRHLSLVALALVAASCQGTPHPTRCTDVDCSGHGTCTLAQTAKGEVPTCICAAGYAPTVSGLLCPPVKDTSLCYGVTCSGHGTCASVHGQPSCACDPGFVTGPGGRSCVDPCDGVTCGGHGTCTVSGAAARCTCEAGYRASADGQSCAAAPAASFVVYSLLYTSYPDYPLGRAVLDLGIPGEGKITETISYQLPVDHNRGISHNARLGYTVDASGKEVTALQFDDETRTGNVSHRRRGELSWTGSKGTLSLQRAGKLASLKLTATGSKAPIPMFGGLDYPGINFGCFSPLFYVLVLGRYDVVAKGTQSLEVVWPDAGQTGSVRVEADPASTPAKPVLRFPDWNIKVTYKDDLPQVISLEQHEVSWSIGPGTPADLNLGDAPAATPYAPTALPTDLVESALSFPSADATSLSATLTVPSGKTGPFPAVLFVSDALAATRDAPYFLQPGALLYRDLAAHLAHAGYASLRFDPRGRGSSKGDASKVTMALMLQDAIAAHGALLAAPNIDKTRIYIVSLGPSSITAHSLVASKTVKGYVALAPVIKDLAKVIRFRDTSVFKAAGFSAQFLGEVEKETDADLQQIAGGTFVGSDWRGLPVALWKEWLAFDGSATLGAFAGPVLVLRGDQDLEIPTEQLQAAIDAATKSGKKNLTTTTLAGLTYNLTEGAIADLWESALLPLEVPSLTLSTLLTWLGQN